LEGGRQKIQLDLRDAGDAIQIFGNHIVVKNKGLQIDIETEETLNPANTVVNGTVKKTTLTTDPLIGEIKQRGVKFMATIKATYPEVPPSGSRIRVTLAEAPTGDLLEKFQSGAKSQGYIIRDAAHTVRVQTQNLDSPATATITMSVSPEWVTTWGRNTIRILRIADEGTAEILKTTTAGYDQFGNVIFTADSPRGFSTFGLVSLLQVSEPVLVQEPVTVSTASSTPPPTTIAPLLPIGPSTFRPVTWFIVPALFIVLIGEGIAYLYLVTRTVKEKM
jgi:hypothetical protein